MATVKRAPRIPEPEFIRAYVKACKQGKEVSEFAESLGMKVESCRARISATKTKAEKGGFGHKFPTMSDSSARVRRSPEDTASLLESLALEEGLELEEVEEENETEEVTG